MLTKNYYMSMLAGIRMQIIKNGLKNCNGVVYDAGYYYNDNVYVFMMYPQYVSNVSNYYGMNSIVIGSGTTQETADDYALESMITTGFTGTVSLQDGVRKLSITNTSSSPIVIGEVGFSGTARTGKNSANSEVVLLDRTTLQQPVTIQPNETVVIDYEFGLKLPE